MGPGAQNWFPSLQVQPFTDGAKFKPKSPSSQVFLSLAKKSRSQGKHLGQTGQFPVMSDSGQRYPSWPPSPQLEDGRRGEETDLKDITGLVFSRARWSEGNIRYTTSFPMHRPWLEHHTGDLVYMSFSCLDQQGPGVQASLCSSPECRESWKERMPYCVCVTLQVAASPPHVLSTPLTATPSCLQALQEAVCFDFHCLIHGLRKWRWVRPPMPSVFGTRTKKAG